MIFWDEIILVSVFIKESNMNWYLLVRFIHIFDSIVFMEEALTRGKVTPELKAHLDDKAVKTAHFFEIVSLIIIVILIVFRPF